MRYAVSENVGSVVIPRIEVFVWLLDTPSTTVALVFLYSHLYTVTFCSPNSSLHGDNADRGFCFP